jgi:cytochrome c biogenesis protein CcmG/thiol:disulfide interchange protein DsbE
MISVVLAFSFNSAQKVDSTPMVGKQFPDFQLPLLDGGTLSQADFHGKKVIVNIFASWCVACAFEHPILLHFAKKNNIEIYGVATRDTIRNVKKWLNEKGSPYVKTALDEKGKYNIKFGLIGVPETFFLNEEGIITKHIRGELEYGDFE